MGFLSCTYQEAKKAYGLGDTESSGLEVYSSFNQMLSGGQERTLVLPTSKSTVNKKQQDSWALQRYDNQKIICGPFISFSLALPKFSQEARVTS